MPGAAHYEVHNDYDTKIEVSKGKNPHAQFNSNDRSEKSCELCVELGRRVATNHNYEDCWINPNSKYFKEGLYKSRLSYLADQGRAVPALMAKKEDKKDTGSRKVTPEALNAFGVDLTHLLEMEGADYETCLREAAEFNLGINVEGPDNLLMFKEGGEPDTNAHTNQDLQG